jgi:tRNA G10  N-methylase Trm11
MLPEIARRAIHAYSRPGDLILDPMCGIATTLVEAIHLDRQAVGVELESRWKAVASKNLAHARRQGVRGPVRVLRGDARRLGHGLLDEHTGRVPLILTSPPYANAQIEDSRRINARVRVCAGRQVSAADRALALQPKCKSRYGDSHGSVARLRYGTATEALTPPPPEAGESYLSAMALIYTACARMLAPGGYLVLVTKNMRANGVMRNIAGDTITLCQGVGLVFHQHIVALLAAIRDDEIFPRPSYFQLTQVRHALARGERTHLVCHEDVLVFRAAQPAGNGAKTPGKRRK